MAEPKYSFDSACYDLAEHFYPGAPAELLNELAQRIQTQVESDFSPELAAWEEAGMQRRCAPGHDDSKAPTSSQFRLGERITKPEIIKC
jgi:hypothetical protein